MTMWLMTALARGPYLPGPHHHGRSRAYDSDLRVVFLRAVVRGFAWQTARGVFDTLGLAAVAVGVVVAVLAWRRHQRAGDVR